MIIFEPFIWFFTYSILFAALFKQRVVIVSEKITILTEFSVYCVLLYINTIIVNTRNESALFHFLSFIALSYFYKTSYKNGKIKDLLIRVLFVLFLLVLMMPADMLAMGLLDLTVDYDAYIRPGSIDDTGLHLYGRRLSELINLLLVIFFSRQFKYYKSGAGMSCKQYCVSLLVVASIVMSMTLIIFQRDIEFIDKAMLMLLLSIFLLLALYVSDKYIDLLSMLLKSQEKVIISRQKDINRMADKDFFAYKLSRKQQRIKKSEILYFEGCNKNVIMHTLHDQIEFRCTLRSIYNELQDDFSYCHRSYIVNNEHIIGQDDLHLILINGERIRMTQDPIKFLET